MQRNFLVGAWLVTGLVLLVSCGTTRSPYALSRVVPQRLEVTEVLDAHPDFEAATFLESYTAGVDSLRMPYIGRSAMYMRPHRPESLLSNWVADVYVEMGRRMGYEVDLGVCNMGGLRSAMPEGVVRQGHLINIAPFQNMFTVLSLRGSDLLELFANMAEAGGEGVSHGVELVITMTGQLRTAHLNGEEIDPARTYVVATLDYLANGNDKMVAFKKAFDRTDTTTPARDVLADYLRALDTQGEAATSVIEGRTVVVEP